MLVFWWPCVVRPTVTSCVGHPPPHRFICKGRQGFSDILPSVVMDTSTASRLSAAWVGTAVVGNATSNYSAFKVSMSTSFGVNDSYFVTTVTLQSLVSTPLYNVSWMRNVDPDQEQVRRKLQAHTEMVPCSRLPVLTHWRLLPLPAVLPSLRHTLQPWSGFFDTSNYVKYQRYRPGEPNRANTAVPNMCLVVATGTVYTNLTLGLGTVHPNCRVSHYGFVNNDATEGWLNSNWTAFDETNPLSADEAINLNYLFPVLDAGASVSFTWAYILNLDDLATAMDIVSSVRIVQPTTTASGASAAFSATVTGAVSSVTFTLSNSSMVGTARSRWLWEVSMGCRGRDVRWGAGLNCVCCYCA